MHIDKIERSGVSNWLRHNNRLIVNDQNVDIDMERSRDNYTLTPGIDIPRSEQWEHRRQIEQIEYARYKEIMNEVYVWNRKDVKTLCGVVVTLPEELVAAPPEEKERFFQETVNYLTNRYGNCVSATVHCDEGKHIVVPDGSGGTLKEFHYGRDHLHFTFVPIKKIDHEELMSKKHDLSKEQYDYECNCAQVVNKQDLRTLHPDFQKYLDDHGFQIKVCTGVTKAQGGNRTVEELKAQTVTKAAELQKVVDRAVEHRSELVRDLQVKVAALTQERDQLRDQLSKVTRERDQLQEKVVSPTEKEQRKDTTVSIKEKIAQDLRIHAAMKEEERSWMISM